MSDDARDNWVRQILATAPRERDEARAELERVREERDTYEKALEEIAGAMVYTESLRRSARHIHAVHRDLARQALAEVRGNVQSEEGGQ